MFLYVITNAKNGKQYVGITGTSLKKRWSSHRKAAKDGVETPIAQAIRKYGPEAFHMELIGEAADRQQLQDMERAEISRRGTISPKGYNVTAGGDGRPRGFKMRPETVALVAQRSREAWARLTPEQRAERSRKISETTTGVPKRLKPGAVSPLKGRPRSEEFREAVSQGMKRMVANLPPGEMSRRSRSQRRSKDA